MAGKLALESSRWVLPISILLVSASLVTGFAEALETERGKRLYAALCANCHGARGEGVEGKYEEPLHGDWTVERLARRIHRTMPEEDPDLCVDDDATLVAAYIHQAFYSSEARGFEAKPRVELSRMTVRQYANSVADLIGGFRWRRESGDERGLEAEYYAARNFRREKRAFGRVDPRIEFRFGARTPDPARIKTNEFAMRWRGSILAPETGSYQFKVTTENGVRLWVNDEDQPLIDAWVSSGLEPREHVASIQLLGGRSYPLRLDYFKFKEKTASIVLAWKSPHGVFHVIPERNLAPINVASTFVATTAFPPDDSSVGYARGASVSRAWDEAATYAALEAAAYVAEHLSDLAGAKPEGPDYREEAQRFAVRFVERAFRQPLTLDEREFFVGRHFARAESPEAAIKRIVLLALKSPRFLYPELLADGERDYLAASRLSFGLWDSLPDKPLLDAAAHGQLRNRKEIAGQARRMLKDPRARTKLKSFFAHWLQLEHAEQIAKDAEMFPGFDEMLVADLRHSLFLFLDEVAWSTRSDYRDLLLADHLYLNPRLDVFYRGEARGGSETRGFQRRSFASEGRAGVITHPYLLAAFAYPRSTSPIHRGVFLTRNIVGRALKPPPMAIAFDDASFNPDLTMREKVAELTRPTACQACHSVINPLGFSLEHFDSVGRFRQREGERPINAVSDYETAEGERIRLTGARKLAEHAAADPRAHRGFLEQLFHQVVKQPVLAYGDDIMEDLHRSFVASEFSIREALVEIIKVTALHGSTSPASSQGDL